MYGGRTNDEATRWACLDYLPVIMSGFTMKLLSHEEFNILFEVRLVRSHALLNALHEYTRLFEGELIRLCMRTHHGDEEQQKRHKQLDKAVRNAKSNSKRRKARDEGYEESARGRRASLAPSTSPARRSRRSSSRRRAGPVSSIMGKDSASISGAKGEYLTKIILEIIFSRDIELIYTCSTIRTRPSILTPATWRCGPREELLGPQKQHHEKKAVETMAASNLRAPTRPMARGGTQRCTQHRRVTTVSSTR